MNFAVAICSVFIMFSWLTVTLENNNDLSFLTLNMVVSFIFGTPGEKEKMLLSKAVMD